MAFLAKGRSVSCRMASLWANIVSGELTNKHMWKQEQGKSATAEDGNVVETEARQLPGFITLTYLNQAYRRKEKSIANLWFF